MSPIPTIHGGHPNTQLAFQGQKIPGARWTQAPCPRSFPTTLGVALSCLQVTQDGERTTVPHSTDNRQVRTYTSRGAHVQLSFFCLQVSILPEESMYLNASIYAFKIHKQTLESEIFSTPFWMASKYLTLQILGICIERHFSGWGR